MEEKVIKIIAEKLNKDISKVTLQSKLVEDLGADSLDIVELMMAFEDEVGVALLDEEVPTLKTVGDIVNYIKTIKKN